MADSDETLDSGAFDPLTSSKWPMSSNDLAHWDSPIEFEVIDDLEISTSAPRPPDVDEILRGEYTGWIPLIRAGESFEEAKARALGVAERALERERVERELRIAEAERAAEKLRQAEELRAKQQRIDQELEQTLNRASLEAGIQQAEVQQANEARETYAREEISRNSIFTSTVEDPLAEHMRIERERRLAEERRWAEEIRTYGGVLRNSSEPGSGEQPLPNDFDTVGQNVAQDEIVADPDLTATPARALEDARRRIADLRKNLEHQRRLSSVHVPRQNSESPVTQVAPIPEPPVAEGPANDVDDIVVESIIEEGDQSTSTSNDSYISKATTDVYEHSPSVSNDQSASVELMIMRDEVQHLREQLDASQKLIHDMMNRFANLAELAILNKN